MLHLMQVDPTGLLQDQALLTRAAMVTRLKDHNIRRVNILCPMTCAHLQDSPSIARLPFFPVIPE